MIKNRSLTYSFFLLGYLIVPTHSLAADVSATFAKIKPSIAVIGTHDGVGTGFCISSNSAASFYLTNAHVVGDATTVTVYRHDPVRQVVKGTVVATGGTQLNPDLAIVRIPVGNIPALKLRIGAPAEGSAVATAGYPSAQYTLADFSGELVPAIHVGTISAVVNRGRVLEYDAQTLPGNSGGPLIDPSTGDVVGVVEAKIKQTNDANIAIGVGPVVLPFLKINEVAYTASEQSAHDLNTTASAGGAASSGSGPLRTLPGAGTVVIVYDTSAARGAATAPAIADAALDFSQKFAQRYPVRTLLVDQHTTTAAELADVARAHEAIMAIPFGASFQTTYSYANAYGSVVKMTLRLNSAMIDEYGYVWYGASKSKDAMSARDEYSAIKSSFDDLSDQVIQAMGGQFEAGAASDSARVNFFRYALPVADGDRRTFLTLVPDTRGARVAVLAAFSPAADAGLQLGDVVTIMNGEQLAGKSQQEILALQVAANQKGSVELTVIGGDGKTEIIKFEPENLRWFVERRSATKN